jgi:hypothetical protein
MKNFSTNSTGNTVGRFPVAKTTIVKLAKLNNTENYLVAFNPLIDYPPCEAEESTLIYCIPTFEIG